jgi:hypothetical protein
VAIYCAVYFLEILGKLKRGFFQKITEIFLRINCDFELGSPLTRVMLPSPTAFCQHIRKHYKPQNVLQFVALTGADILEEETGIILKLKSNRMKTRANKVCSTFVFHTSNGEEVGKRGDDKVKECIYRNNARSVGRSR